MRKVTISPCKSGDTRTAEKKPTIEELDAANDMHRGEVYCLMRAFAEDITARAHMHDFTKSNDPFRTQFYDDFRDKMEGKLDDFTAGEWYQDHIHRERHHLNDYAPEDVNFIDVLEMMCDVVCAGMARTGKVENPNLSPELLMKAYNNTFDMLVDSVELYDKNLE